MLRPHALAQATYGESERIVTETHVITEFGGLKFDVREGTSDWNTVSSIITHDEYEVAGQDFEGKLVFDIGAHIGGLTVLAASRGAEVVALEPIPENCELIAKNAALNGALHRVFIEQGALSHDAEVAIDYGGDGHHTYIGNAQGIEHGGQITVPGFTFDALVQKHGLPDFLKIDCEGGEWVAFVSSYMRVIPVVAGEYHHGDGRSGVMSVFGATHDLWFHPEGVESFGVFRAVLRG